MERNLRAPELRGKTMGTVVRDREDELTLFIEMRKREKERSNLLLQNLDEIDPHLESRLGGSPIFKMLSSTVRKTTVDDFLNSDSEKSDYDWLLTPPDTPLFPYLEKSHRSPVEHNGTAKGHPTLLKSRLANPSDPSSRTMAKSRQIAPSGSLNSLFSGMRRPSSSGGSSVTSSRPATPNGRQTVPAAAKLPRLSTPTSRPALSSKLVVSQPRSSTPARSSTPTSRSSIPPANKPPSRSDTPTRRSSISSSPETCSAPFSRSSSVIKSGTGSISITRPPITKSSPGTSSMKRSSLATCPVPRSGAVTGSLTRLGPTNSVPRSAMPADSVPKSNPTSSKIVAPSRGPPPTVRSKPWKPSEMPGFSFDAPPNLRTTLPERSSPSRGRPGAPSSRSSSVERGPIARPRRQSCSPSRGRAPKGNSFSGSSVPAASKSRINCFDNESPVVIGTKMVERAVNLRRLAPPKHDDLHSSYNTKSSSNSPDSTGFGRALSKKSLDMAMRHMDIRRSIPNTTLRPLMSNIPASSLYSVRSGSLRSRAVSVSDSSPLATTSSNASSEQSISNSAFCLDGNEIEHDICSANCVRTSPSFFPAR